MVRNAMWLLHLLTLCCCPVFGQTDEERPFPQHVTCEMLSPTVANGTVERFGFGYQFLETNAEFPRTDGIRLSKIPAPIEEACRKWIADHFPDSEPELKAMSARRYVLPSGKRLTAIEYQQCFQGIRTMHKSQLYFDGSTVQGAFLNIARISPVPDENEATIERLAALKVFQALADQRKAGKSVPIESLEVQYMLNPASMDSIRNPTLSASWTCSHFPQACVDIATGNAWIND